MLTAVSRFLSFLRQVFSSPASRPLNSSGRCQSTDIALPGGAGRSASDSSDTGSPGDAGRPASDFSDTGSTGGAGRPTSDSSDTGSPD